MCVCVFTFKLVDPAKALANNKLKLVKYRGGPWEVSLDQKLSTVGSRVSKLVGSLSCPVYRRRKKPGQRAEAVPAPRR